MKNIILTFLLLLISSPSWAGVTTFNFSSGKLTDNVLDSAHATTNFSTNTSYTVQSANTAYIQKYDLSSIAGQTAAYAHLYVYMQRGFQHTNNVYRVLQNFNASQSTWNVYSTGNNWNTAGASGSGTDFTPTNSTTYAAPNNTYQEIDVTNLVNDCLSSGNNCDILMRWGSGGGFFDILSMANNATNPPYMIVATTTPGVPNTWYVRDGGGNLGTTSSTCNGTTNALFTGANGPNCAVKHPDLIVGNGQVTQWNGGDIMSIDGDSDISYAFTVSGVTTGPAVGDTYTNNSIMYTVTVPLPTGKSSGTISASGSGPPTSSGTLTQATGSGDATISFSAEGAAQAIYKITSTITVPGGISGQQTKIIGTGSHWPQFWVAGFLAMDASASHIDLENIDMTGHDNCIVSGPIGVAGATVNPDGYLYVCNHGGTSAAGFGGVQFGGTDLTIENMDIHNLNQGMVYGIQNGVVGNNTFTNLKVFGNSEQGAVYGGFNGQTTTIMTGLISLINSQIDFNGCGQRYPLQDSADIYSTIANTGLSSSVDNESNYYNCWSQNQGGYGDGYGYAGGGTAGNWFMSGSSLSFNTSDGFDTLHGTSNGITTVVRSRMEGNGGQQLKLTGNTIFVSESLINGDCSRWIGTPETSTTYGVNNQQGGCTGLDAGNCGFNIASGDHGQQVCRANGSTIVANLASGVKEYYYNNTVVTNHIALEIDGSGCDATTGLSLLNNIFYGGGSANNDGALFPGGIVTGAEDQTAYIYYAGSDGNGTGTCGPVGNGSGGVVSPLEDYNVVYNMKNNNNGCKGTHDVCGSNPGFSTNILTGPIAGNGAPSTYYHGTQMISQEPLLTTSPAKGAANFTGLTYTNGTSDYNNFTANTPPDSGGLQYGSNPQFCSGLGLSCTTNTGCCSGFCVAGACAAYNCGDGVITSPEVCDVTGPQLNSETCVSQGFSGGGSLNCAAGCLSFDTSGCSTPSCTTNGGACTLNSQCCNSFCVSNVCASYNCGDGTITPPEVCDGANLNSQTCNSLGFTAGGSLSCNSGCLSFNTSGCANSAKTVSVGISGGIHIN